MEDGHFSLRGKLTRPYSPWNGWWDLEKGRRKGPLRKRPPQTSELADAVSADTTVQFTGYSQRVYGPSPTRPAPNVGSHLPFAFL